MMISSLFSATSSISFKHLALNSDALMVRGPLGLPAAAAMLLPRYYKTGRLMTISLTMVIF